MFQLKIVLKNVVQNKSLLNMVAASGIERRERFVGAQTSVVKLTGDIINLN